MIKISSLDFLNREVFDIDIMAKDGSILYSAGDPITPEIILNLYFKEIYVAQNYFELQEQEEAAAAAAAEISTHKPEDATMQKAAALNFDSTSKKAATTLERTTGQAEEKKEEKIEEKVAEKSEEEIDEALQFDEEQAKRMAEYACALGKMISIPEKNLKELEQAAYYHKIGRKLFKHSDLAKPDFKKRQAEASYEIMLNELNFPEKIAGVAKSYMGRYNTIGFKLDKDFLVNIPYSHIVSIVSYYEELLETQSKEEVLAKMLQSGGNRFNIFILHKFINMMRETNG